MSDVLSFYYDGAIVQAVKVRIAGTSVTVLDAKSFPFDEFDAYLSACKDTRCIVCCNPSFFYQDIINLPPAATKHYDKLVRSEIQNAHPDLTSFSFFQHTIGEATLDAKPYSKIAAFSYPDDFLANFSVRLNGFGITIARTYAAPYVISRLALSTCSTDPGNARIFIATLPGEKLLLACENSELEFIRKIPSHDRALLPEDAYNINMTVDYCFQSLRVRPFEAVMLNQPGLSEDLTPLVSVPFRESLPPQLSGLPPHIVQNFLAPVAAALHSVASPRSGNILPADYASFTLLKKFLTLTSAAMFVLTLLLGGYLATEMIAISKLKTKISGIRTAISSSAQELAAFQKVDAEINKLKQPLEFVNKRNSSPNPAAALAALVLPPSNDYRIKGITVQQGGSGLDVNLHGIMLTAIYSETQAAYENLVAALAKLRGYSIVSSSVDIRQKTFSIQSRFVGGGQSGK